MKRNVGVIASYEKKLNIGNQLFVQKVKQLQ
jgi:hypothetical protein